MKKQSFSSLKNKLIGVFKQLDSRSQEQFVDFAEQLYLTTRDLKNPFPQQMSIIDLLPLREKEKCDGCNKLSQVISCPDSYKCDFKCRLCYECIQRQKHSDACKRAIRGEFEKAVRDGELAVP